MYISEKERWKVRREFKISYRELCNKFPDLPINAKLYGCHSDSFLNSFHMKDSSIILTLDFDEEEKK